MAENTSSTAALLGGSPAAYGSVNAPPDAAFLQHHTTPRSLRAVHVRHLTYTVRPSFKLDVDQLRKYGVRRPPPQTVVTDLSFDLAPGQLLAVLGSSGSGKSTLLDLIACREDGGVRSGTVHLGDAPSSPELFRQVGGYVVQEDRLLPLLTVRETLLFVAHMKMPTAWPTEAKQQRVDAVMSELGLRHVADTRIGGVRVRGISGGERRRVSIAAQLLLDPGVLLLDEPTSGLDAFTAFHICETLQRLAHAGRTVITTIHAPRSDIFTLFDRIMLLTQGRVAYYGPAKSMPAYFSHLGYPCPPLSNPCDYYVDLTSISYRSADEEAETTATVDALVAAFARHQNAELGADDSADSLVTALGEPDQVAPASPVKRTVSSASNARRAAQMPGFGRQFWLLFKRNVWHQWKDRTTLLLELVQAALMAVVIGSVFWMMGMDQVSISDRMGCIYILSTVYMFVVILTTMAQFDAKRPAFYLERLDGLYDLEPFVLAEVLGELVFILFFAVVFALPIYFMVALDLHMDKVLIYLGVMTLGVYASRSVACAVSAGVVRFQQAAFVMNLMYTFFVLPAGFLINIEDIWVGLRWFKNLSHLAYTTEAAAANEFHGLVFECPEYEQIGLPCPISTGEEALAFYGLQDADVIFSVTLCAVFVIVCRMLQYLFLRFVDQRPRG